MRGSGNLVSRSAILTHASLQDVGVFGALVSLLVSRRARPGNNTKSSYCSIGP